MLWAAAFYNLTWGTGVILFSTWPFECVVKNTVTH